MTEMGGVPFESNPPPDAMPDLDLEVDGLPFAAAPEMTAAGVPPEQPERDQEEQHD